MFFYSRTIKIQIHASLSAATPGRTLPAQSPPPLQIQILPSSSSNDAPPPVDTWLTLSSVLYFAAHVAVSPPPMMVVAPLPVASTTAAIIAFVPARESTHPRFSCDKEKKNT
jgi:hypothetical protein